MLTRTDSNATAEPFSPHAMQAKEVLRRLGVDPRRGLPDDRIAELTIGFGPNELPSSPPPAKWRIFVAKFQSVVVAILLAATIVSAAMGEWIDSIAILAIVVLNAVLGFIQEGRAEQALAALKKMASPTARALRRGRLTNVSARELVPGDVVALDAGDHVPADCRLISGFGIRAQEASLTGESVPVEKIPDAVLPGETPLADRQNMVYFGTVIAAGKATAVVARTGLRTELGGIAKMLQATRREPTPLERQLARLGRTLLWICLGLVAVIFLLEFWRGRPLVDAFFLSVSLAVAAVPEGLPAVVTVSLAVGLRRMAARNALVRKLASVETLGAVTVICTDKTGTLTRNEMTVKECFLGTHRVFVTGVGYEPVGEFLLDGSPRRSIQAGEALANELTTLLTIGARCNSAKIFPDPEGKDWRLVGDPTEGALLVAAIKAHVPLESGARIIHEIPFDSDRRAMSVVYRESDGRSTLYLKGAPEATLERCSFERQDGQVIPLTDARRRQWTAWSAAMAARSLRVLGFAQRDFTSNPSNDFPEVDLIFAGLAGMMDPPREEAKDAVALCRRAGVKPIMITGDHPHTAAAIARELHIASEPIVVVTGVDLDQWDEASLVAKVESIPVYARVSAEHKLRIVKAWKRRGDVVAMTGDGVNDAPAVQAADIGVAMGASGTDVTRQAAAMVLLDDNFASIVHAIEEGRTVYQNIQKFLIYLLACNAGELILMLAASAIGWPAPLIPIQLLWINLVTDGLAALALGLEAPEPDVMHRRPRRQDQGILSIEIAASIVAQGLLIAAVALAAFALTYQGREENLPHARTITFCVLVYTELLRAFAARSQRLTLFQLGIFTNPYLLGAVIFAFFLQLSVVLIPLARPVFATTVHSPVEWLLLIGAGLLPVSVVEIDKLRRQWMRKQKTIRL